MRLLLYRAVAAVVMLFMVSGAHTATVSRDVLWKPQFNRYNEDVRDLFDDNRQFDVSWHGFPGFSVPEDPQWTEDPFLSRAWEFYYHSLGWLFGLAYGHDQDPGQQYLDSVTIGGTLYRNFDTDDCPDHTDGGFRIS